jgi:hypothetical protein
VAGAHDDREVRGMTRAIVFAGPSLAGYGQFSGLDFELRPPVAEGDVLRALEVRPSAVGIIDGYFEQRPSVWHKEILFALSRGVRVFGAASMGALRAAELHGFGMIGIGRIFEAYRDGLIEGDDEVAVAHAPAELGYQPLSEALVNVRFSLEQAVGHGIVDRGLASFVLEIAREIFFKERTWQLVFERACQAGLTGPDPDRLQAWLEENRVDQKAIDAYAMISALSAFPATKAPAYRPTFELQRTSFFERARQRAVRVHEPK